MTLDVHGTARLQRVVDNIVGRGAEPLGFLSRLYFPTMLTSDVEDIFFDVTEGKPRITPFVAPHVAGQPRVQDGYVTKHFRPAYAKDKPVVTPKAGTRRRAGEQLGGALSAADRLQAAMTEATASAITALNRRFEVMAAEVLRTGKQIVKGENYPETLVDFGRAAGLTVALVGAARWGEAGVKPLTLLRGWAGQVRTASGTAATVVVMDDLAFGLLMADEEVQKLFQVQRGTETSLSLDPKVVTDKAVFQGKVGSFEIWTYNDTYVDPEDGVERAMLPDYSVILGSPSGVEGIRHHGAIQDVDVGLLPKEYAIKTWTIPDPSARFILLQSAPLLVPYRPNASFFAKVR